MAKTEPKPNETPTKRRITDREAVERDYRTSQLTLREIEAKHHVSRPTIIKWAKSLGWVRGDLADAVRAATTSLLVNDAVKSELTRVNQGLTNEVLAAAEANKGIVLGHRKWLTDLAIDALAARAKLLTMAESAADIREANTVVQGIEASSRTFKTLIEAQRRAFNLDNGPPDPAETTKPVDLTDTARRILYLFNAATAAKGTT